MRFTKSPAGLVTFFDGLVAETGGERRLMFGCPCAFANGNMFAGLFGSQLFVRLDQADRSELLSAEGAQVFDPMGGRPMREYVVVPKQTAEDASTLRPWLKKALRYASSLPGKGRGRKPAPRKTISRKPARKNARRPAARPGRSRVER